MNDVVGLNVERRSSFLENKKNLKLMEIFQMSINQMMCYAKEKKLVCKD